MNARAWVDGAVCDGAGLPAGDADGVFETMGAFAGALPLWDRHLLRMRVGAARLGLPWQPPRDLAAAALDLLCGNGHDVVRVALERREGGVHWVMTTRARDQEAEPLRVVLAGDPRAPTDRDDVKVCRRASLDAARAQGRALGAHDALLWRAGNVLEATAYNVFVAISDRLCTPPADGSILPGIARDVLLRAGVAVEAPVPLAALAHSPLVVLTNAVYGPRRAFASVAPPAAHPWMTRLRAAWQAAIAP